MKDEELKAKVLRGWKPVGGAGNENQLQICVYFHCNENDIQMFTATLNIWEFTLAVFCH